MSLARVGSIQAVLLFFALRSFSQTAAFDVPALGCLDQDFVAENSSTNATNFEWDFCQGDLSMTPHAAMVANIGGNVTTGIDMVYDGTNWYGFATSRETNTIIRADFGASLSTTPTIVSLGNIGGITPWRPTDIHVVYDNGWYGFVYGESTNLITRINFGNSLANTAGLTAEVILIGTGSSNCGLDISKFGTQWLVTYSTARAIGTIVLDNVDDVPAPANLANTGTLNPVSTFGDIKTVRNGNSWYAYSPDNGNGSLWRARFDTDPLSMPVVENIDNSFFTGVTPYGLDIGQDDGQYRMFVCTIEGALISINLGSDLDAPPLSGGNLGNLGVLGNTLKLDLLKEGSEWTASSLSWNGGELMRLTFPPGDCIGHPAFSTAVSPEFRYTSSGAKAVTLRAFAGRSFDEAHAVINVSTESSPVLSITSVGACVAAAVNFTFTSTMATTSTTWDFGDGNSSSATAPSHLYGGTGDYNILLKATATNGCSNVVRKTTSIYDPPVASFELPSGLMCTNKALVFPNTTPDNFDGLLAFRWEVDDDEVSTATNLTHSFTGTGDHDVRLVASIPGCSSDNVKTVVGVLAGPSVDISLTGQCADQPVEFTSSVSGDVVGYEWNFGDGGTASTPDALHPYDPGVYNATLIVDGSNGCETVVTEQLTVYNVPEPAFVLDLPPFSCARSLSQFHDITAPLTDSNLNEWQWMFGDGGTGSGKNAGHTYGLPGEYPVTLEVTSDKGCDGVATRTVTILPSPEVAISNEPGCAGQQTKFTSTISSAAASWQWKIGSATYLARDPVHIFATPGTYSVEFTANGTNNCIGNVNKQVVVPVKPQLSIAVENACIGQEAVLTAVVGSGDQPVSYSWSFNDGSVKTGLNVEHTFNTVGQSPLALVVAAQSGCHYAIADRVNVHPVPVAVFQPSKEYGASPMTVVMTNQSTGASTYMWQFNDAEGSTSTDASPSFTYRDIGSYNVVLTATSEHGCSDTSDTTIHVIIPYTDLQLVEFSLVRDVAPGLSRGLLRLRNNSNFSLAGFNMEMDLGSGIIITQWMDRRIEPMEEIVIQTTSALAVPQNRAGSVCVAVRIEGDEVTGNDRQCTTLNENSIISEPYPNPSDGQFLVDIVAASPAPVQIRIFNSSGALAYSTAIDVVAGLNVIAIDLGGFADGLYLISVQSPSAPALIRRIGIVR